MLQRVLADDLLPLVPAGREHIRPDGFVEYRGPCPVCGEGHNRFYLIDFEKYSAWWCRKALVHPKHLSHERGVPLGHEAYWQGENLWEILTGKKWNGWNMERHVGKGQVKQPQPPPPTIDEIRQNVRITMDDVYQMHRRGRAKALAYWGKRGISEASVDKYLLGYVEHPKGCALPAGYTIPNIALDGNCIQWVRSVDVRRDDAYCKMYLQALPTERVIQMCEEVENLWKSKIAAGLMDAAHLHEPTPQEVMDYHWDKYRELWSSEHGVWGDDLLTLPDKSRYGPKLEAGLVVESKADAILLRQLGYPAFAYKRRKDWDYWLPTVFRHVHYVFIIADRDEQANNAGEGLGIAKHVRDEINKGKMSIANVVLPPPGYKDPGEIAEQHGLDMLDRWVQGISSSIAPILREERVYA